MIFELLVDNIAGCFIKYDVE